MKKKSMLQQSPLDPFAIPGSLVLIILVSLLFQCGLCKFGQKRIKFIEDILKKARDEGKDIKRIKLSWFKIEIEFYENEDEGRPHKKDDKTDGDKKAHSPLDPFKRGTRRNQRFSLLKQPTPTTDRDLMYLNVKLIFFLLIFFNVIFFLLGLLTMPGGGIDFILETFTISKSSNPYEFNLDVFPPLYKNLFLSFPIIINGLLFYLFTSNIVATLNKYKYEGNQKKDNDKDKKKGEGDKKDDKEKKNERCEEKDGDKKADSPLEQFSIIPFILLKIGKFYFSFTNSSFFLLVTLSFVLFSYFVFKMEGNSGDKRKHLSGSSSQLTPFAAGSGSDDPDDDPHKRKKRKFPRECEAAGIDIDMVRHMIFAFLKQDANRALLQNLPDLTRTQAWNNAIREALAEEGRGSNIVSLALDLSHKGPQSPFFRKILARATLRK